MSDQQKPGTPAVTSAAVNAASPSDSATLQMLVQLLLAERQEALLEREEKKKAAQARNEQQQKNAEYAEQDTINIQKICSHRKGGKGLKGPKVDYAVSFHTFVNSESAIRCLICKMKWKNTDTPEFLMRRGKKVENHTGIGWKDAYRMVTESSNTATSSEVKLVASPEAAPKVDFEKVGRSAVEI
ncbi:Uncharacterised protein [uncultured archaeon]|nr:Uncharacterised protein [uncultured archaeon]